MSDKLRGALFNALGDISGLRVLDAFSGSGAISFEAISRGAKESIAIERDARAYRCISENIEKLGVSNVHAIRANVSGWSSNNPDEQFDLVICDPPYDLLQDTAIHKMARHVSPGGICVLSWPVSESLPKLPTLSYIKENPHADARLVFYSG